MPLVAKPAETDLAEHRFSFNDQKLSKPLTVSLIRYNKKIYDLAYTIFLYSQKVEEAYFVALAAVKQNPNNPLWIERLAQTALWTNRSLISLDQWLYLLKHGINASKAHEQVIFISKLVRNYELLVQILKKQWIQHPNNSGYFLEYIAALEKAGYPFEAKDLLNQYAKKSPREDVFNAILHIEQNLSEPNAEIKTIDLLLKLKPNDLKLSLQKATLLLNHGKLNQAYQVLLPLTNKAPATDTDFWMTFGDTAWNIQKPNQVSIAYSKLLQTNQLDQSRYIRLMETKVYDNKQLGLKMALRGWLKFHSLFFAEALLSNNLDLERWTALNHLLEHLPKTIQHELSFSPSYWLTQALTNAHFGRKTLAFQQFDYALTHWPWINSLKMTYLWFLINDKDKGRLKIAFLQFAKELSNDSAYTEVYALGLSFLGHPRLALKIYEPLVRNEQATYDKFIQFADFNQQTNNPSAARYYLYKAWVRLLQKLASSSQPASMSDLLALANLSHLFASNALTERLLFYLVAHYPNSQASYNLLLNWAIGKQQNLVLANYLSRYQRAQNKETTPSDRFTLALANHDTREMDKLLHSELPAIPYRDAVTGAIQIQNRALAEELAYRGLKAHPTDPLMAQLFQESMLPQANAFNTDVFIYDPALVTGFREKTSFLLHWNKNLTIEPYDDVWLPHATNNKQITNVPSTVWEGGIRIKKLGSRNGWWLLDAGERKGLASYGHGVLKLKKQLAERVQSELILGFHRTSLDTAPMVLGGMKNEIRETLDYKLSQQDTLIGEAAYQYFYGQDSSYLGRGFDGHLYFSHAFFNSHPDWKIKWTMSSYLFTHNGQVSPLLQTLIPPPYITPGTPASVNFYIPLSAYETDLTIGFGQNYKEDYTHMFRPFMEVGGLYNTVTKFGPSVTLGAAGMVIGRDHLVIYAEYIQNQQSQGGVSYSAGARYNIYF